MAGMIYATDLRPGNIIEYDKTIYAVVNQEHVQTGQGQIHVQLILKEFHGDAKRDFRVNADTKIRLCSFEMTDYRFQYDNGDELACSDEHGEEILFPKRFVDKDILNLLDNEIESAMLRVYKLDDEIQKITLPKKAPVIVADTEPWIKGRTANASSKPAQLKNGWKIYVPIYIERGDTIIIDTETMSFDSKA